MNESFLVACPPRPTPLIHSLNTLWGNGVSLAEYAGTWAFIMRRTTHMHVVSSYIINDYATLARCPVACMLSVVLKADMASR